MMVVLNLDDPYLCWIGKIQIYLFLLDQPTNVS
jgi:hypothetical protein